MLTKSDPYWPGSQPAKHKFISEKSLEGGAPSHQSADRVGALFTFPQSTRTVKSKIGVSWISTSKSCEFLGEIPGWDVKATAAEATKVWNDEVLDSFEISDTRNATLLTMFYSALYRTALLPSNRTGENPFWEDFTGYYDDICRWLFVKASLTIQTLSGILSDVGSLWKFSSNPSWQPSLSTLSFQLGDMNASCQTDVLETTTVVYKVEAMLTTFSPMHM
jgi:Glycosyl hydrolase family 92